MINKDTTNNFKGRRINQRIISFNSDDDSTNSLAITDDKVIQRKNSIQHALKFKDKIPKPNTNNDSSKKKNYNKINNNTNKKIESENKKVHKNDRISAINNYISSECNNNNDDNKYSNINFYYDKGEYIKIINEKEKISLIKEFLQKKYQNGTTKEIYNNQRDIKDKENNKENNAPINKENSSNIHFFIKKVNHPIKVYPNTSNNNDIFSSNKKEINNEQKIGNNNIKFDEISNKKDTNIHDENNAYNLNIIKRSSKKEQEIKRKKLDLNKRRNYIEDYEEEIEKDQNGYRIEKKYINENILNKEIKNNEGYEDIKVIDNDQEDDEEKEIGVNGGNEYLEGYVGNCEPLNERNGNCFNENIKFIEDDEEQQDDNELNNLGLMYME